MDVTGISLMVAVGMLAVAILSMFAFSARSIATGKHDLRKVLTMVIPFALFGGAFIAMGDAAEAGMLTMFVMIALLLLFIAYSGLRRSFK